MLYIMNFIAFQVGWFASVFGGAREMPWLGPAVVFVAIALHIRAAKRPADELLLVLSCALIGAGFDSALVAIGWVEYASGMVFETAAPYWIVTMWMLFATTLNVSMRWLRNRELLASVFGFVGGPLAYIAGQKLGGIVLVEQFAALLALGIGWAAMMPVLLRLSTYFDGFGSPAADRGRALSEAG